MSWRNGSISPGERRRPRASPHAERVAAAEIVSIPRSLQASFDRTIAWRSALAFNAPKWDTVSYSGRGRPSDARFLQRMGQPKHPSFFAPYAARIVGPE